MSDAILPTTLRPIVLIGGDSRAARSIRQALPGANMITVSRAPGADVVVADYLFPPAGAIPDGATIVNCVGSATPGAVALDRVNRAIPVAWAEAGRAASAAQFVQLSSFSVFGRCAHVDFATLPSPINDYGRSKLAAEHALAALGTDRFKILSIRFPILVGQGRDKLGQLLRLVRRVGIVPRHSPPVRRAMLTYEGLGAVVAHAITCGASGIWVAADPEPFSYELVFETARHAGLRIRQRAVPGVLTSVLRTLAPDLHQRLFASMTVNAEVNVASALLPYRRLRDVIATELTA